VKEMGWGWEQAEKFLKCRQANHQLVQLGIQLGLPVDKKI